MTRLNCMALAATACLLLGQALLAAPQQASSTTAKDKRDQLNGLARQTSTVRGPEIAAMLHSGLSDPDPTVTLSALMALAARAGGPRFMDNDTIRERWRADHAGVQQLRPQVVAALDNENAAVRRAAVLALGNLDFDLDQPATPLSADTVRALATHFGREADAGTRVEIIKGLAVGRNQAPEIRQLFAAGLSDDNGDVQGYAALGAARIRDESLLPRVVRLLESADPTVRFNGAKALDDYGATTASYLEELHKARDRETDSLTHQQLDRVIAGLEGRR